MRLLLALLVALLVLPQAPSEAAELEFELLRSNRAPQSDLVLAGGLDGRVFALHAWSGDVLWTFDSGGPMVDSSTCEAQAQRRSEPIMEDRKVATASTSMDGTMVETKPIDKAVAASAAFMERLVPSYDGRLYHFADNKVTELEMTMADIVNANGPVRLAAGSENAEGLGDVMLVGNKRSELFALDAASGLVQPFPSSSKAKGPAGHMWTADILFGRSEYSTQALHARNASFTRCFRISEYFLQFAKHPHCAMADVDGSARTYLPPEILVIPKDPDAARGQEEGSTIAGFDPYTNEQLWEFEIPDFDALAVFGLSPSRGSTFYQWRVDGPSSSSAAARAASTPRSLESGEAAKPGELSTSGSIAGQDQPAGAIFSADDVDLESIVGEPVDASKQLTRVVPRSWDAVESRFRLRLLEGENYFLESNAGGSEEVSNLSDNDDALPQSMYGDDDHLHDGLAPTRRRRRILWESMENDGKRGVFITYYHAGAMLLMTFVGSILIAWGCYVKGLSASIAQTAIKSMDQSQFFVSHVHQLTIERPGEENITISSVISRALLMDAAGSIERPLRLLGNGEAPVTTTTTTATTRQTVEVNMDPETEAMLLQKFSRMAASEAASLIAGGRYSSSRVGLRQLEYELDSKSSSDLSSTLVGNSSNASSMVSASHYGSRLSMSGSTLALPYDEEVYDVIRDDDCDRMEYEVKMLPSHDDFMSSDSDSDSQSARVVELLDSDESSDRSEIDADKSVASSWKSDNTTGSCFSQGSKSSSHHRKRKDSCSNGPSSVEDNSTDSASVSAAVGVASTNSHESSSKQHRKGSDASSSLSSSSDDQSKDDDQVFLPFVCQSRFLHEFEEISAIGKGGFGQVVLAENRLDGRKYAIKRVGLNLKNQTSKTLQKFLREVKILALLDHPNIVRYYQAWLEKVEESTETSSLPPLAGASSSMNGGESTFGAGARNYSMSNLLAPISEMDFASNQDRTNGYYGHSQSSIIEEEDDGGFEWERDSSDGNDANAWKEEDLVVQNKPPVHRQAPSQSTSAVNGNGSGDDEDSTTSYSREKCDHLLYIQMQYCAGRNLGDYLAVPGRPMELRKLLKIFIQIASALAHVHSCGLIHRDLKPANIFVADTDGDSIKLGDFGLSRYAANVNLNSSVEDQLPAINRSSNASSIAAAAYAAMASRSTWSNAASESNDVTAGVGTYLYASPEQVAGKKYNAKTDVYSLGMILFELCHERFGTTMERYVTLRSARDSVLPERFIWRQKCPEVVDMLLRLLHRDPQERPTADEVVQWGQQLYESSMDVVRSPRLAHGTHHHHHLAGLDHLSLPSLAAALATSTFTLQVEAASESGVPNHNLLKEVCDVIGAIREGQVEIKKFGLHLEDEGAQILEFVLDAHAALAGSRSSEREVVADVMGAIEALCGVRAVRQTE